MATTQTPLVSVDQLRQYGEGIDSAQNALIRSLASSLLILTQTIGDLSDRITSLENKTVVTYDLVNQGLRLGTIVPSSSSEEGENEDE